MQHFIHRKHKLVDWSVLLVIKAIWSLYAFKKLLIFNTCIITQLYSKHALNVSKISCSCLDIMHMYSVHFYRKSLKYFHTNGTLKSLKFSRNDIVHFCPNLCWSPRVKPCRQLTYSMTRGQSLWTNIGLHQFSKYFVFVVTPPHAFDLLTSLQICKYR